MIQSFGDDDTLDLFIRCESRRWRAIESVALRKLDQLEASSSLFDLRVPPGNRLEVLRGNRAGQYSVRINAQFRICFRWQEDGANDVEITDYH